MKRRLRTSCDNSGHIDETMIGKSGHRDGLWILMCGNSTGHRTRLSTSDVYAGNSSHRSEKAPPIAEAFGPTRMTIYILKGIIISPPLDFDLEYRTNRIPHYATHDDLKVKRADEKVAEHQLPPFFTIENGDEQYDIQIG